MEVASNSSFAGLSGSSSDSAAALSGGHHSAAVAAARDRRGYHQGGLPGFYRQPGSPRESVTAAASAAAAAAAAGGGSAAAAAAAVDAPSTPELSPRKGFFLLAKQFLCDRQSETKVRHNGVVVGSVYRGRTVDPATLQPDADGEIEMKVVQKACVDIALSVRLHEETAVLEKQGLLRDYLQSPSAYYLVARRPPHARSLQSLIDSRGSRGDGAVLCMDDDDDDAAETAGAVSVDDASIDASTLVEEVASSPSPSASSPRVRLHPCGSLARSLSRASAQAVHALHEGGAAHRALSPAAILARVVRDAGGERVVATLRDFSRAATLGSASSSSALAHNDGGPGALTLFSAPEVLRAGADEAYDAAKADVWSLGMCLAYLLTGTLPFCPRESQPAPRGGGGGGGDTAGFARRRRTAPTKEALLEAVENEGAGLAGVLRGAGLSEQAVTVLVAMLRAEPERRASLEEVLQSAWLGRGGGGRRLPASWSEEDLEGALGRLASSGCRMEYTLYGDDGLSSKSRGSPGSEPLSLDKVQSDDELVAACSNDGDDDDSE